MFSYFICIVTKSSNIIIESPVKEEYYETASDSVKSLKNMDKEPELPVVHEPAILMITPKPKEYTKLTLTRNHRSYYLSTARFMSEENRHIHPELVRLVILEVIYHIIG